MAETAPTQNFVKIDEIKNGTVYLKNGGMRKVLMVSGVNFDLKSEEEQKIILRGFQNFINMLDFSIQFFVHSRKMNVGSYLAKVKNRKRDEDNELLRIQIEEYVEFIRSFVEENPIITKDFFVVVPYNPVIVVQKAKKGVLGFFKKEGDEEKAKEQRRKEARKRTGQLNYRVEQVVSGLEQIGLYIRPLNDKELMELFYNLYNPELVEKEGIEIPKRSEAKGEKNKQEKDG